MARVEEDAVADRRFRPDLDGQHVAHGLTVTLRHNRTLLRVDHLDAHCGGFRDDRAAPAAWAKRGDGRQRQNLRTDG